MFPLAVTTMALNVGDEGSKWIGLWWWSVEAEMKLDRSLRGHKLKSL